MFLVHYIGPISGLDLLLPCLLPRMPLLLAICPLLHELSYCPLLYALCPAHLPSALPHYLLPCFSPDLLPSATSRLHTAFAPTVAGIEPTA